jgi:hypothetical protein
MNLEDRMPLVDGKKLKKKINNERAPMLRGLHALNSLEAERCMNIKKQGRYFNNNAN